MLLFVGELLDVQEGDYKTLVFKSTKFDRGLQESVPCSESVGISDECAAFIPNYKKHIGEMISVPIAAIKTKRGGIFLLSQGDLIDIPQMLSMD